MERSYSEETICNVGSSDEVAALSEVDMEYYEETAGPAESTSGHQAEMIAEIFRGLWEEDPEESEEDPVGPSDPLPPTRYGFLQMDWPDNTVGHADALVNTLQGMPPEQEERLRSAVHRTNHRAISNGGADQSHWWTEREDLEEWFLPRLQIQPDQVERVEENIIIEL